MLNILLVEDDVVDIMTVKKALKDLKMDHQLNTVNNGREALDYLTGDNQTLPDIILLDINMPIMNGIEFLKERREHESLEVIPVIVLTTSENEQDRLQCYKNSISGYMVKPIDYTSFLDIFKLISNYWTSCKLPY